MSDLRHWALLSAVMSALCANAQIWTEHPIEAPTDVTPDALFGWSVSLVGDRLLVGAPGSSDLAAQSGATYVFGRNVGGEDQWGLIRKLEIPSGLAPFSRFGNTVLLHEDRAYVSAPFDVVTGTARGAVYVFGMNEGGPDNWGLVQRIVTEEGREGMRFGWSLALEDDVLMVGAPNDLHPDSTGTFTVSPNDWVNVWHCDDVLPTDPIDVERQPGSLVVFRQDSSGQFVTHRHFIMPGIGLTQTIHKGVNYAHAEQRPRNCFPTGTLDNPWCGPEYNALYFPFYRTPVDQLASAGGSYSDLPVAGELTTDPCTFFVGHVVASSSDRLAAKARGLVGGTGHWQVFTWIADGDSLIQEGAVLLPPDGQTFQEQGSTFNSSLATAGDRLFIGSLDLATQVGKILVYRGHADTTNYWYWSEQIVQSDPEIDDTFGWSVSATNTDVAVGSPDHGTDDRGKVYVFQDPSVGIAAFEQKTVILGPNPANTYTVLRNTGPRIGPMEVRITDTMGRVCGVHHMTGGQLILGVSDLPNGIYVVTLKPSGTVSYGIASLGMLVIH